MIPVTVLTGFLGSGKTTLLSRLLATPGFARTAVIVNEFGEIGLDHDLVEAGDETVVALTNGCLCCRVQTDLSRTLGVLRARREAGEIDFDRVVVETSGLADPAPILHALATDPQVAEAFAIERVVATVDVATAGGTFARYAEARRQVAMADLVLLTKADLAPDAAAGLGPLLDGLNRLAPRLDARGRDAVDWPGGPADRAGIDAATLQAAAGHGGPHAVHEHDYSTVCILREKPVPAAAMLLFLEGIQTHEGSRLLRLKGLVGIAEMPDRPMVVHGVQHVFHQPSWLDRWPSDDRRTRIVMIGHGLSARWSSLLLEALEAEVEALRHRTEA